MLIEDIKYNLNIYIYNPNPNPNDGSYSYIHLWYNKICFHYYATFYFNNEMGHVLYVIIGIWHLVQIRLLLTVKSK